MFTKPIRLNLWHLTALVVLVAVVFAISSAIDDQLGHRARPPCVNNLREIVLGLANAAATDDNTYPQGAVPNPNFDIQRRLSWLPATVPYMESVRLDINTTEAWDSAFNRRTIWNGRPISKISGFVCPNSPIARDSKTTPGFTSYVGITGVGADSPRLPASHPRAGVFAYDRRTRRSDVTDGLANTMCIAETNTNNGPWTSAISALRAVDPNQKPYLGRHRPFGGIHGDGANVAFLDGSVRYIKASAHPRVLEAAATIAGDDVPGYNPFEP